MKKRIMIIICMFMIFITKVNAVSSDNYTNATTFANNYLEQKNYSKYSSNLILDSGVKFSYISGSVSLNTKFTKGGFLNKEEYEISGSSSSYFDHGVPFWSMTESGTNSYVISNNSYEPNTSNYEVRITEYINPSVEITGSGSKTNPWKFKDNDSILVTFDNQGATTAGTKSLSLNNGKLINITSPEKTYYDFEGYYSDKNGSGIKYYNSDGTLASGIEMVSEDITLYAKWKQNTMVMDYCTYTSNSKLSYKFEKVDSLFSQNSGTLYYGTTWNGTLTNRYIDNKIELSDGGFMYSIRLSGNSITIPGSSTVSGSPITISGRGNSYTDYGYIRYNSSGKVVNAGIFQYAIDNMSGSLDMFSLANGQALLIASNGYNENATFTIPANLSSTGAARTITLKTRKTIFMRMNSSGKIDYLETFSDVASDQSHVSYLPSYLVLSDGGIVLEYSSQYTSQYVIPSSMTSSGSSITINTNNSPSESIETILKFNSSGKIEWAKPILFNLANSDGSTGTLRFSSIYSDMAEGSNGEFALNTGFYPMYPGSTKITIPGSYTATGSSITFTTLIDNTNTIGFTSGSDAVITFNSSGKVLGMAAMPYTLNSEGTTAYKNDSSLGLSGTYFTYNKTNGEYSFYKKTTSVGMRIESTQTTDSKSYLFGRYNNDTFNVNINRLGKITSAYDYGGITKSVLNYMRYNIYKPYDVGGSPLILHKFGTGTFEIPSSMTSYGTGHSIVSTKEQYIDTIAIKYKNNKIVHVTSLMGDDESYFSPNNLFTESDGSAVSDVSFKSNSLVIKDYTDNKTDTINKIGNANTLGVVKFDSNGKIVNKFFAGALSSAGTVQHMMKLSSGKYLLHITNITRLLIPKAYNKTGMDILVGDKDYYNDSVIILLSSDFIVEEIIMFKGNTSIYGNGDNELLKIGNNNIFYGGTSKTAVNICGEATSSGNVIEYTPTNDIQGIYNFFLKPTN